MFVAVWSRAQLNQAGCATVAFTRVEQSACGLSRLGGERGEKKISCFINVLWSLAGSSGFAVLFKLREIFYFQLSKSSFNPGSLERRWELCWQQLPVCQGRATPERDPSPLQPALGSTCTSGCHSTVEEIMLWDAPSPPGSLPSVELSPIAMSCHKGPQRGLDSLPWDPVPKSGAELTSLQLRTCTSVSGVPLEQGMKLTEFQLQARG